MSGKHQFSFNPCVSNIIASRRDRSGAMMMVQIVAGTIGRRSRYIVMIGKRIENGHGTMRRMVIRWLRVGHCRRMN